MFLVAFLRALPFFLSFESRVVRTLLYNILPHLFRKEEEEVILRYACKN
jgi:hypothetical protein